MDFNDHSLMAGQHAFLSASNYHWINYDEDKLEQTFLRSQMAKRGTELHDLAHRLIRLGVRLPENGKTLSMYVNDALRFGMSPEQMVYYTVNCYGTADTIKFARNKLRIHDYKSGVIPASVHQLEVYAAYFCLEYGVNPFQIDMEFRIYQNDERLIFEGDPTVVVHIMDKAITFSKRIDLMKKEVL